MLRTAGLSYSQKLPLTFILLVTFAVHAPLLLMRLPSNSFDANFHMAMASHYAHHWFDPWNENSLAGFSQTTYPPLTQQWIGLLSHVAGLTWAYILFQFLMVMLLPLAVFRYARLWVSERAASYAALGSVFLGSLCLLVYQDGQIGTTSSTTLFLLALPFFYSWAVEGRFRDLAKALVIGLTAAAAHHATTLFGSVLFAVPVVWLAHQDHRKVRPSEPLSAFARRVVVFFVLAIPGLLLVLLPYFLALIKNPINQLPIPHQSRANFLLDPIWGLHYWLVPMGAVVLALPYIFRRGTTNRRLLPLFCGFYLTLLFGLGGTTPIPRLLLGRAFEILTFERFTFWALLMALPIVGLLVSTLLDRYKKKAAFALGIAAIATASLAVSWNLYFPLIAPALDINPVVSFLNRGDHSKYRYLTLGFGNAVSRLASLTNASSVDGEYNSARTLPEMTRYGSAQLTSSKYYGVAGIESLSAMLRHAPRYGLKYIFVHDRYYEPLLQFSGWRLIDSFNQGQITVWTTIGIPPAHEVPSPMRPPAWQGIMWGTLPFGMSVLAIILVLLVAEPRNRKWQTDDIVEVPPRRSIPEPSESDVQVPTGTACSEVPAVQAICLISAFPPGRGDLNEYGYHLARTLKANRQVDLTVLAEVMEEARPELDGFQVQRCWKFNSVLNFFHVVRAVTRIDPDVVWFNIGLSTMGNRPFAAFANTLIPAFTTLLGYNTHITLHAFFENVELSHANVRFPALYRLGGRLATRILLWANGVHVLLPSYRRTLLEKYRVKPEKIHVHSHGVFSAPTSVLPSNPAGHKILAFGSWGTYKRLEDLLEALPAIQREVPDVELIVAGGDHPKARGYLASLKEKARGNGAINFVGYVPEAELGSLFRSATLAVLPYSSGAGSSGVAHLACEYGLPIVASDLADFVEMASWEHLAVQFYARGDRDKLAQAVVRLLQSPEFRAEMAAQNLAAAERITFDHLVNEYLETFQTPRTRMSGLQVGENPPGGLSQNPVQEIQ